MSDKTDVDNHHPCNKTHCKQCFNEAAVEKVAEWCGECGNGEMSYQKGNDDG